MSSIICPDENPLGIASIDHLEFTCANLSSPTRDLFKTFGFVKTYERNDGEAELFSQGQVRFLLVANSNSESHSQKYLKSHGEGVSKISFLVENAEHALSEAKKRGATVLQELHIDEGPHGVFKTAAIQGFGDVANEFVERPKSFFRHGYEKLEEAPADSTPLNVRAARIDHLTNNVPHGEMQKWVDFYKNIYGFRETRYFDIKGVKTGLESKVVQLANGNVIIPINEPSEPDGKSQIQEFLDLHKGPGVQHIALSTPNIIDTVGELITRDVKFLDIPHTYYEDIPKRNFTVEEDLGVLEKTQLLVDGDPEGYLIQNFTETYIGPLFFEFIQRKKHNGFGEGNFQALFDAIERDQMKRGYLE